MELVLRPVNKGPPPRTSEHPGDTHCMVKMEIILNEAGSLCQIPQRKSSYYHFERC